MFSFSRILAEVTYDLTVKTLLLLAKHATNFQKRCVYCVFWTTLAILCFDAIQVKRDTYVYETCNDVEDSPVQHLLFVLFQ